MGRNDLIKGDRSKDFSAMRQDTNTTSQAKTTTTTPTLLTLEREVVREQSTAGQIMREERSWQKLQTEVATAVESAHHALTHLASSGERAAPHLKDAIGSINKAFIALGQDKDADALIALQESMVFASKAESGNPLLCQANVGLRKAFDQLMHAKIRKPHSRREHLKESAEELLDSCRATIDAYIALTVNSPRVVSIVRKRQDVLS